MRKMMAEESTYTERCIRLFDCPKCRFQRTSPQKADHHPIKGPFEHAITWHSSSTYYRGRRRCITHASAIWGLNASGGRARTCQITLAGRANQPLLFYASLTVRHCIERFVPSTYMCIHFYIPIHVILRDARVHIITVFRRKDARYTRQENYIPRRHEMFYTRTSYLLFTHIYSINDMR